VQGNSTAYCPRRTLLDKILVDAARDAGAEVREAFTVKEIIQEGDRIVGVVGHDATGNAMSARAEVVIGADGRNSRIAKWVKAEKYHEKPILQHGTYTYWRNLPVDGAEVYIRPYRGWGVLPTNDDCTLVVVGWPHEDDVVNRRDIEANYMKSFELAPRFARRIASATRVDRFYTTGVENWFRKPYGKGWALVGDAGYDRDPITAQGISDSFFQAELCATAVDEYLTGARDFEEAMADYQQLRDKRVLPMYEFTTQLATLEPPPPELQQLLGALHGQQDAMDDFVSVTAGTLSPDAFFDPQNVERIMNGAPASA
jgi:flavin-dependent dehydrogenase